MLKPCPMCYGEAELKSGNYFWVSCKEMHMSTLKSYPTKEEAIQEWNNRPIENELIEALEEVFHLLEEHTPHWYKMGHFNKIKAVLSKAKGEVK